MLQAPLAPAATASSTFPDERFPAITRWSPLSTNRRAMLNPIRPMPQIPMSIGLPSVDAISGQISGWSLTNQLAALVLDLVEHLVEGVGELLDALPLQDIGYLFVVETGLAEVVGGAESVLEALGEDGVGGGGVHSGLA